MKELAVETYHTKLVKSHWLEISWLLLSFGSRLILGNTVRNQLHREKGAGGWLAFGTERIIWGVAFGLDTKARRRYPVWAGPRCNCPSQDQVFSRMRLNFPPSAFLAF